MTPLKFGYHVFHVLQKTSTVACCVRGKFGPHIIMYVSILDVFTQGCLVVSCVLGVLSGYQAIIIELLGYC